MFNKDVARANDARLLELAKYIESKGTTRHIRNMSDVFKRFGYLKCLLKNGSFDSLNDLEDSIYSIFGIVDKDLDFNENAAIMSLIKQVEDDLKEHEKEEQDKNDGCSKKHP